MNPIPKLFVVAVFVLLILAPATRASLIFLYDFPGDSGLAADQTNPQPANATFSDFTRNNVDPVPSGGGDSFGSNNWSLGGSIDLNVFESFTITADLGFVLSLDSLTFTARRSATGPQNMEVALFLNGSMTAYATYDFSPTTSTVAYAFNFTPITDADNVTSATFKFYGWNAGGSGGQLYLDDVGTYGAVTVPEADTIWPIALIVSCVLLSNKQRAIVRFRSNQRC
jgi:hypothetical protein